MIGSPPAPALRDRAAGIIATGTILAVLYLARDVLVPITLAVMLSLALSPLVRALRRLGLGATSSVLAAVLVATLLCAAVAAVIGVQAARMAQSLPEYEQTIRYKLAKLNELTVDRVSAFTHQTERILGEHDEPKTAPAAGPSTNGTAAARSSPAMPTAAAQPVAPIPVELREPPVRPLELAERVVASMWVPLETAGIVLVVLIFVLLERESVRDRFIRIAGGADLRATTLALNDAGERLSRFFLSQLAVNLGVGVLLWIGLAAIRLPQAMLWAALAAVLRFVPYIGVWIAALFAVVLAAAVDPGWSLVILTLCLFVAVELVAGQFIEPQLYGHTTGLSPLSVVVAAIFWSWLWGPVGLVVSTPLTLCLVVAGRHVKALSLLDVLLGDSQALTLPQRFYQRALSADHLELIANARGFLKHNSLADYCDYVLMPALTLAVSDLERGKISAEQQMKVRQTVVTVVETIDAARGGRMRRRDAISVLDQLSAGRELRRQRELLTGRWQGPLVVPPGSVTLCVSAGSMLDDLATELLVRVLREKRLDARHLSLEDLQRQLPPETTSGGVSMVYLVSGAKSHGRESAALAGEQIRGRFPGTCLVTLFLPGALLQADSAIDTIQGADKAAASYGEALQICLDWHSERTKN
jgi:predicted PurR-regulated permease PerM